MGRSFEEEERRGCSEGEKTSLRAVTTEVTTVILPVTEAGLLRTWHILGQDAVGLAF